ncbi:hypothetical protein pb186bvf_014411 [Paramecium bursaria]
MMVHKKLNILIQISDQYSIMQKFQLKKIKVQKHRIYLNHYEKYLYKIIIREINKKQRNFNRTQSLQRKQSKNQAEIFYSLYIN